MQQLATHYNPPVRWHWLLGRKQDLYFFFLPIPFAFLLYFLAHTSTVAQSVILAAFISTGLGAEKMHLSITWFCYLDKENRDHYLSSKVKTRIFFVVPLLIIALTIAVQLVSPLIVIFITMAWTIQHVLQQNVGILLLYHNKDTGEAIVDRKLETRTQYAAGAFFCLVFFQRALILNTNIVALQVLTAIAFAWMASLFVFYLLELRRQIKDGAHLNASAFAFWLYSCFHLYPLAFMGTSYSEGYLISLFVHWCQYIGLNYNLVKKKYTNTRTGSLPIQKPLLLFFGFAAVLMTALYFGQFYPLDSSGLLKQLLIGFISAMAMCHYFLDGFIYRFRDPFQRATILPFLRA
jgi:hypothetical protein